MFVQNFLFKKILLNNLQIPELVEAAYGLNYQTVLTNKNSSIRYRNSLGAVFNSSGHKVMLLLALLQFKCTFKKIGVSGIKFV